MTRRFFTFTVLPAILGSAPFVSCGGGDEDGPREPFPRSNDPPLDLNPVSSDPDYPAVPQPPEAPPPEVVAEEEPVHAEGFEPGTPAQEPVEPAEPEPDIRTVLDDLMDRAGEGNVETSLDWMGLYGHPAVVGVVIREQRFDDCLYFELDDQMVVGADVGVLMAIDRTAQHATWWCGGERLSI